MPITHADYARPATLDAGVPAYYFGGAADGLALGDNDASELERSFVGTARWA